jgi:hypothetical protein
VDPPTLLAVRRRRSSEPESMSQGVVLYLDDVEALRAALAEDGGPVEILTKDAELESVDELKRAANVRELDLTRREPYVSVWFRGYGARLHAWDDDVRSRAICYEVRSILDNCKKRWWNPEAMSSLILALVLVISVVGLGLIAVAATEAFSVPDEFLLAAAPIVLGINLALLGLSAYGREHFGFKLIPRYRHEHSTFWNRNKDTLLVQGLLLIPTNVLTALIVYFLIRD